MILQRTVWILAAALLVNMAGCVNAPRKADFTRLRTERPSSILVVPVINKSVDVNAPEYFLATISKPLAERGYYVFPVNMVRSVLADDGLSDAHLVHTGDPHRLGELFGADSVMYISIERWDARYVVLSTAVTVELNYSLKSTKTGAELWTNHQLLVYQPHNNNNSGGLAGLLADVIAAAITKAAPNYVPLAQQANGLAINTKGTGLPAGPHDALYLNDTGDF